MGVKRDRIELVDDEDDLGVPLVVVKRRFGCA
jgi:hypothetical protein